MNLRKLSLGLLVSVTCQPKLETNKLLAYLDKVGSYSYKTVN